MKQSEIIEHLKAGAQAVRKFGIRNNYYHLLTKDNKIIHITGANFDGVQRKKLIVFDRIEFGGLTEHFYSYVHKQ